jgi:hypothetical protein
MLNKINIQKALGYDSLLWPLRRFIRCSMKTKLSLLTREISWSVNHVFGALHAWPT